MTPPRDITTLDLSTYGEVGKQVCEPACLPGPYVFLVREIIEQNCRVRWNEWYHVPCWQVSPVSTLSTLHFYTTPSYCPLALAAHLKWQFYFAIRVQIDIPLEEWHVLPQVPSPGMESLGFCFIVVLFPKKKSFLGQFVLTEMKMMMVAQISKANSNHGYACLSRYIQWKCHKI